MHIVNQIWGRLALAASRGEIHKKFGPSPKLTHWIYTGIIGPKITYAAHVWCGGISNYIFNKKSRQFQRWALTKMVPIRENTPTAG